MMKSSPKKKSPTRTKQTLRQIEKIAELYKTALKQAEKAGQDPKIEKAVLSSSQMRRCPDPHPNFSGDT